MITETRVSPRGNVAVRIATDAGDRFWVQVPAHRNAPEYIAEAVRAHLAVGRVRGPRP